MAFRFISVVTALLLISGYCYADNSALIDEVLTCAKANAPAKTFNQTANFVTSTADGAQRSVETRILGERTKEGLRLNLRVTAPAATAGTSVLIREKEGQDDMRIFLPATGRTQGVTGSMAATKLLGTDFSYNDLKQMFGAMLDGQSTYVGEIEVAGHKSHQLRLVPAAVESAPYTEALVAFHKATCVPLVAEFRAEDGQLLRTLTADVESLASEDDRHYAYRYRLQDLITETETTVEFSKVTYDEKINRRAFNPNSFKDVD